MFVRWKRYPKRHGDTLLAAVLVEAYRQGGRPRQRIVAYLGSIRQRMLDQDWLVGIGTFWDDVDRSLDGLDLTALERRTFEAKIALRVPRPDTDELVQARREYEEEQRRLVELLTRLV